MDRDLTEMLGRLKAMECGAAADALMASYPAGSPNWGAAIELIGHLSWPKKDQVKLAKHYLSRLPFANAKPYEVFANIMSLPTLLQILKEYAPSNDRDKNLFRYYAKPALERAKPSDSDRKMVEEFFSNI